mgnify:CR=1 FL=1
MVEDWDKRMLAQKLGQLFIGQSITEDCLDALVEDDEFACNRGYFQEIEFFHHSRSESGEELVRLSFVTAYYFTNIDTGLSY